MWAVPIESIGPTIPPGPGWPRTRVRGGVTPGYPGGRLAPTLTYPDPGGALTILSHKWVWPVYALVYPECQGPGPGVRALGPQARGPGAPGIAPEPPGPGPRASPGPGLGGLQGEIANSWLLTQLFLNT